MCRSCEELCINGVNTREIGCPDAWQDYEIECPWCGGEFLREEKEQRFCCDDCAEAYNS